MCCGIIRSRRLLGGDGARRLKDPGDVGWTAAGDAGIGGLSGYLFSRRRLFSSTTPDGDGKSDC